MEQLQFENQGTNTFLVYRLTGMQVDTMSLGMLTNNNIPGFAPAFYTQQDGETFIKYNITARIDLRQFFSGTVNKARLLGVFGSIVSALRTAEDYMLDLNTVLLELDYIFVDVSTSKAQLICVPVAGSTNERSDFLAFFKSIMFSTQFEASENCDHVMRLINYFNSSQTFSLDEFGVLLSELENEVQKRPVSSVPGVPQGILQVKAPAAGNVSQIPTAQAVPVSPAVPASPAGVVSPGVSVSPSVPVPPAGPVSPAIPVPSAAPPALGSVSSGKTEKDISLFYLLQHYNKENAAAYKAQKAEKKNMKADAASKKQKKSGKKGKNEPMPPVHMPDAPVQPVPSVQPVQSVPSAQPVPSAQVPQSAGTVPPVGGTPPVPQPAPASGRANFGETTVLSAQYGETTMLTAPPEEMLQPYLVRTRTGEKIRLNKAQFSIGKEKSFVDYFIGDNTAVSRSHASFIVRDGSCFVMDTNSTNHTYVNDRMIASNVEILLNPGDKIRLANEEFEFVRL